MATSISVPLRVFSLWVPSPVVTVAGIPRETLEISSSSMLASTSKEEVSDTATRGVPAAVRLSPTCTDTEDTMPPISVRTSRLPRSASSWAAFLAARS